MHYKRLFFKFQYEFGFKVFENGGEFVFHPISKQIEIKGFYTFFNFCYENGHYFSGEHHSFWEVVYCRSGAIGVSADEKVYRLCKGDIIVYPPNVHHKLWAEDQVKAQGFVFSFDAEGEGLKDIIGAFSCDSELKQRWDSLFFEMNECEEAKHNEGYLKYLKKDPYLFQKVANQCELNLLSLRRQGLALGTNQSKNALDYERIVQMMQQNVAVNLSVEELSKLCGLGVSTMKKLFRQFNSMGIHEYFLHLKMQEAIYMLNEGKTVTETAEALGFSNQSYFSTAFKRIMKKNPAKFKFNEI